MLAFKVLKLKTENNRNIFYNKIRIEKLKKEIEELLKRINNYDSASELMSLLGHGKEDNNLSKGYFYILQNKEINKDSLKELYDILSNDLLDEYSLENMGKYYRKKRVFILDSSYNGLIGGFDKGMNPEVVEERMDSLLNYINEDNEKDIVDTYIKSQIIHYYLVCVHPNFDVNGRTARTLSTWYLLNKKADPCILFNKGISNDKDEYKDVLKKSRRVNITAFIEYSLKVLKKELEKEIFKEEIEEIKVTR